MCALNYSVAITQLQCMIKGTSHFLYSCLILMPTLYAAMWHGLRFIGSWSHPFQPIPSPHWVPASFFPLPPDLSAFLKTCLFPQPQSLLLRHQKRTLQPLPEKLQRPRLHVYHHQLQIRWRVTWHDLHFFCASLLQPLVSVPADIQGFQHVYLMSLGFKTCIYWKGYNLRQQRCGFSGRN